MELNELKTVSIASLDTEVVLDERAMDVLLLRVGKTTDLSSAQDVANRVFEFIHLNSLNSTPLSLGTINRRFGRIAKRFDTGTADILEDLSFAGRVVWIRSALKRYVFSKVAWDACIETLDLLGQTETDLTANLLRNAE